MINNNSQIINILIPIRLPQCNISNKINQTITFLNAHNRNEFTVIIRWVNPANSNNRRKAIMAGELDKFIKSNKQVKDSLADLLLKTPNSVILHADPERKRRIDEVLTGRYLDLRLMGQNFNEGADGTLRYRLIVQDVNEGRGPWVLFDPEGNYKTFHLMHHRASRTVFPRYLKIPDMENFEGERFVYIGRTDKVFSDFRKKGYSFSDDEMPETIYDHYEDLLINSFKCKNP